jgi:hypothetical protein
MRRKYPEYVLNAKVHIGIDQEKSKGCRLFLTPSKKSLPFMAADELLLG